MKIILGFLLMSITFISHAADTLSMNVNNNVTSFKVTLAANPTTGFQWTAEEYDKDLLTLTDSEYIRPKTKLIGAGGEMMFVFTLNKGKTVPKSTKMLFKYARAWETGTGKEQTVVVNFINPS
ncbi:protease inhibitor I42 family protein [uncultured Legionella sp.]|uniref:protease inhibitor I42 family protein n=1 Tax=uncultured Legionella sp. TaxID=210934 RepID=UPI002612FB91|nr:protease inhibitor I42 family protein [uncultured Legionella sp.]